MYIAVAASGHTTLQRENIILEGYILRLMPLEDSLEDLQKLFNTVISYSMPLNIHPILMYTYPNFLNQRYVRFTKKFIKTIVQLFLLYVYAEKFETRCRAGSGSSAKSALKARNAHLANVNKTPR